MKIIQKSPKQVVVTFKELPRGQVFKAVTNAEILMKIESIFCDIWFTAVSLTDGTLTPIDDTSLVIPLEATVVVD